MSTNGVKITQTYGRSSNSLLNLVALPYVKHYFNPLYILKKRVET